MLPATVAGMGGGGGGAEPHAIKAQTTTPPKADLNAAVRPEISAATAISASASPRPFEVGE